MMTKRDIYFLELATKQALSSSGAGGAYLGAVLVGKNRLLSFGTNQPKTHPFQAQFSKKPEALFLHAENAAINNALRQMSDKELCKLKTTLYVARIKRKHTTPNSPIIRALAKPCVGCMTAIFAYNINRIVYTVNEYEVEIID
jgi:tRNA(Arg) A34 adenosine deaminase TadA